MSIKLCFGRFRVKYGIGATAVKLGGRSPESLAQVQRNYCQARVLMSRWVQGVDDPLEEYCETAPDADECRVYELSLIHI